MFDFINKLKSYQIAIFIIFVWLVITAIINPSGNFPLGDDWAYAKPVKTYLETGIIKLTDWASMTLIMQIFFGIIATKIFGFSFTVLRLLTIIFGTLGSVGTFYFLKENNLNNKISIFITFLLIFNPVYFLYSFCFMTDIPFYAFMIWSLVYITKFFSSDKTVYFLTSLFLILIALLIRDLAIIFPVAFSLAYIPKKENNSKKIIFITLSALIIFGVYFIYNYWLSHVNGIPKSMERSHTLILLLWKSGIIHICSNFLKNSMLSLIFMGFYFFPVLILLFYQKFIGNNKKTRLIFIGINCLVLIISFFVFAFSPEQRTKVYDFMFNSIIHGYFTWIDVNVPSKEYLPVIPVYISYLCYTLGIIGGIILINLIFDRVKHFIKNIKSEQENTNTSILLFNYAFLIVYIIIIFSHNFYNRYLILLFPVIFVLLKPILNTNLNSPTYNRSNGVHKPVLTNKSGVGLILSLNIILIIWISYFSIASAHDWLSFNRARWQGAGYLINELKVSPNNIDGGFEFNGWFTFNYSYAYTKHSNKNWWWVNDNSYYIGWGKSPYYEVIREICYTRWYSPCLNAKMYVQKRKN